MRKYVYLLLVSMLILISGCSGQKEAAADKKEKTVQSETKEKSVKNEKNKKENKKKPAVSATETKEEPWTPITDPANAPEDWKNQQEPPYCLGCGRTKEEVSISRDGYCGECFTKYYEPTLPHCDTCGGCLYGGGYIGNRHPECYHCDYCGGEWNENYGDHWDSSYGFACCECYIEQIVGCSQCGYRGDMSMWESGMCDACLQQWEQNESQVYCSYCGQPTNDPDPQYGLCPVCLQMKNEIESYPW